MKPEIGVPDGGWGWAVVTGTAIINIFNQSLLSMFGLVFGSKLQSIAGTTGVTTVMSLNCTISNFSGFLITPLSKCFSTKQITQIGVILVALGLGLSAYTRSYTQVTLGYGILAGLGLGLIASSTFLIINSYFDKNKSQAVGLAMAGTSVGQMGMPPVVAFLVEVYGYEGTILILSSLSLHGLIGAMFFDPVSEHMVPKNSPKARNCFAELRFRICCRRKREKDSLSNKNRSMATNINTTNNNHSTSETNLNIIPSEMNSNNTDNKAIYDMIIKDSNSENTPSDDFPAENHNREENRPLIVNLKREESNESSVVSVVDEEESMLPAFSDGTSEASKEMKSRTEERQSQSCWKKVVSFFELQILLDPIFVHIMIGLSLAYTTSISFSTFFPLFLTVDLDMNIIEASTCMSALSLTDFIGRILVPIVTKYMDITHRTTFIIGSFALAISRSILVEQTTYTMVMFLSTICGLARAATVINQNLVIAEYSKEAHVSSALGLNMVSKGIFVLTIGRLLGEYKDSAHNYSGCIHILNIISMAVVLSWSTEILMKKIYRKLNRCCRKEIN